MEKRLRSYPKVWSLGHKQIRALLDGPVVVQEKIDGSQFSFGVLAGELHMRSKGAIVYAQAAPDLFRPAVDTALRLFQEDALVEGWTYRGEAVCRPRHNALTYERAPKDGFILYDVDTAHEDRVEDPAELAHIAHLLGIEHVPLFYYGEVHDLDLLRRLVDGPSMLGGVREGIVIKNYNRFADDGKMLMGKLVSDSFKEVHKKSWGKDNPTKKDSVERIIERYATEARWQKAVQHLREAGLLDEEPRDIGKLIKEVGSDVLEECREEIAEALFNAFWKDIQRGLTRGLPEWYKAQLAEAAFAEAV